MGIRHIEENIGCTQEENSIGFRAAASLNAQLLGMSADSATSSMASASSTSSAVTTTRGGGGSAFAAAAETDDGFTRPEPPQGHISPQDYQAQVRR